jgi:hypothetical protein
MEGGVILVHFTSKGSDLVPRDFRMFSPMKEALRGRRFSSDEEVIGLLTYLLTPWCRIFFVKLIVTQVVKK